MPSNCLGEQSPPSHVSITPLNASTKGGDAAAEDDWLLVTTHSPSNCASKTPWGRPLTTTPTPLLSADSSLSASQSSLGGVDPSYAEWVSTIFQALARLRDQRMVLRAQAEHERYKLSQCYGFLESDMHWLERWLLERNEDNCNSNQCLDMQIQYSQDKARARRQAEVVQRLEQSLSDIEYTIAGKEAQFVHQQELVILQMSKGLSFERIMQDLAEAEPDANHTHPVNMRP